MQVVVATPLSGGRARLAEALGEIALPGLAVAGAAVEAGAGSAGGGSVAAIVWFEWGPVLIDVGDWDALDARAEDLQQLAYGGGLQILPPSEILALEPGRASEPDAPGVADDGRIRRACALSANHLREVLIELARERYERERWSTADVLWTLDLLRLPSAASSAIDERALLALGFPASRVPLLDGRGGAPDGSSAQEAPGASDETALLAPLPPAPGPPPAVPVNAVPPVAAVPQVTAVPPPQAAAPLPPSPPVQRPLLAADAYYEPDKRRISPTVVAALVAIAVIIISAVVFLQMLGGDDGPGQTGGSSSVSAPAGGSGSSAAPSSEAAPSPSPTLAKPAGYVVRAADAQVDCAQHAYGQTAQFLTQNPCVQVQRQLLTGTVGGRPVVAAVREVTMATPDAAGALLDLVDTSGTGNVNDLLREGATYPGGPSELPAADYGSAQSGARVRIVEVAFTDGAAPATSSGLQKAADTLARAL